MLCHVLSWDRVAPVLAALRRDGRVTYQQAVEAVGNEGIAHAILGRTALTSRLDRDVLAHGVDLPAGETFDPDRALDVFNEEWVGALMNSVLENGLRTVDRPVRRDPRELLRYMFELAMSPNTSDSGILRSLQTATNIVPRGHEAQGAFFVWQWIDDLNLWNTIDDLEAWRHGPERWYDVSLPDLVIECKDWGAHPDQLQRFLVAGSAGEQLMRDLSQGPLARALWVFSERMPVPRGEFYDSWFPTVVEATMNGHARHPVLGPLMPTIRANWSALRTAGLQRRVVIHDPVAARALAAGQSVAADVLDPAVQDLLRRPQQ